jgi:hypothetical protein
MAPRWRTALCAVALLLGALGSPGCDRDDLYERPLAAEGAYVVADALFTWDSARAAFVRVDLTEPPGGRHPITRTPLAGDEHRPRVSPAGDALLVLTRDERRLTVLPADGAAPVAYPLDQPFDALTVSADGRYAVAFAGAGGGSRAVAIGHNLLNVVDLTSPPAPGTNPRSQTVSSYGGERLGVDISPEFLVNGAPHRLAVIRSVGHVALLDLAEPAAEAIGVPLVVPGDTVDRRPQAARFAVREEDAGGLWILLWAAGDGDVIALDVAPRGGGSGGLRATLNQHAVGGWVVDAVPVRDGAGRLHVAALSAAARLLALIDVETGQSRTFSLDTAFGAIREFRVARPGDGVERAHVLLSGAGTRHFAILAVDEVPEKGAKALRLRSLREPYGSILPIPGQPRFVAFDDANSRLTLVWLEREAAEDTFAFHGAIVDRAFGADGSQLYLIVESSELAGHLVRIRLLDGALAELPLDARAQSLALLPDSGRLVVVHDDPTGLLTLVEPDDFARTAAERIFGFLLDGML